MALTDSLVAHYLLNTDATDSYGSYDGTVSGTVVFTGNVAIFDGASSYIDTTYKTSNASNTYTISIWVSRNSINTQDAIYTETNSTDNSSGTYIVFGDSGTISAGHFKNQSGDYDNVGGSLTVTTDLTHIVFTRENGVEHKLYIDGILYNTVSCSNVSNASTYTGRIGGHPTYSSNPNLRAFDGSISNFRIYSDVKDQAFIDELYLEGHSPEPTFIYELFSDVSEDVNIIQESFFDISEDDILESVIFQDVSEDAIIGHEIFSDVAIDSQGYMEIFTDVSINEKAFKFNRFLDISEDITIDGTSIIIERIN